MAALKENVLPLFQKSSFNSDEAVEAVYGEEVIALISKAAEKADKYLKRKFKEKNIRQRIPLSFAKLAHRRLRENAMQKVKKIAKEENIPLFNRTSGDFAKGTFTANITETERKYILTANIAKKVEELEKLATRLKLKEMWQLNLISLIIEKMRTEQQIAV